MANKKRKIGFYYLTLNTNEVVLDEFYNDVIDFISRKDKIEKKISIKQNKFGYLSSVNIKSETRKQLIFKSGILGFRPPLINGVTVDERDNPKTLVEGDRIKTHVLTKAINGDIVLLLERSQSGLSINQILFYLNSFVRKMILPGNPRFEVEPIAADNFLEIVNSLSRIVTADVYVDKQLLGSAALDYTDRIQTVQHEIIIGIKATRGSSIVNAVRDIFTKFNGGSTSVRRMRVVGRNNDNNLVKINTEFIERQEYVNPRINETTGEIITENLLEEMEVVLHNF